MTKRRKKYKEKAWAVYELEDPRSLAVYRTRKMAIDSTKSIYCEIDRGLKVIRVEVREI